MSTSLDVVILAAERGTRMRSDIPKVLHRILGLPLLEYVLRSVAELSPERILVVVDQGAEEVRGAFADRGLTFVEQEGQCGTGHALLRARGALGAPRFLVLPGDVPLVPPEALKALLEHHTAEGASVSLLTFAPPDPGRYGRVIRDESGKPRAIVDPPGAPAPAAEVASGIYCLENAPELWEALEGLPSGEAGGQLADLVAALYPHTAALRWREHEGLIGVDSRLELARAERILKVRIAEGLMDSGVTVVDPWATYIGPDVEVGRDTVIFPGTHLLGRTGIGKECTIGPDAYLLDTTVMDRARIWYSVLESAWVGEGARIGPFAHLRPGARIGTGARIGNFVEIKNSVIGEGVRAGHLSYIGDAEVGEGTNIGAGTITCNYDGVRKHRTVIGKGAFIGSNTALVAPVVVGEGAVVGAGSVITDDVPPYSLAIGRARQVVKPEWVRKRREIDLE